MNEKKMVRVEKEETSSCVVDKKQEEEESQQQQHHYALQYESLIIHLCRTFSSATG
jgi:hypothetical protein